MKNYLIMRRANAQRLSMYDNKTNEKFTINRSDIIILQYIDKYDEYILITHVGRIYTVKYEFDLFVVNWEIMTCFWT